MGDKEHIILNKYFIVFLKKEMFNEAKKRGHSPDNWLVGKRSEKKDRHLEVSFQTGSTGSTGKWVVLSSTLSFYRMKQSQYISENAFIT